MLVQKNGRKIAQLTVYLDNDVKIQAKERGICFTQVFQNAIAAELENGCKNSNHWRK